MTGILKKYGQSTLEYAVLIAIITAALVAMRMYMVRGMEGRLRDSSDEIGSQYSAGNTTYKYVITTTATDTHEEFGVEGAGISNYSVVTPMTVNRSTTGGADETNPRFESSLF